MARKIIDEFFHWDNGTAVIGETFETFWRKKNVQVRRVKDKVTSCWMGESRRWKSSTDFFQLALKTARITIHIRRLKSPSDQNCWQSTSKYWWHTRGVPTNFCLAQSEWSSSWKPPILEILCVWEDQESVEQNTKALKKTLYPSNMKLKWKTHFQRLWKKGRNGGIAGGLIKKNWYRNRYFSSSICREERERASR